MNRSTCDSVLVSVNHNQLPRGASLQFMRLQPNAWLVEIRWNPGPAALPGYYPVTVRARCDECPLPIRVDRTFVLHVRRRRPGPAPTAGGPIHGRATAAPNPFIDETRLTLHLPAPLATPTELQLYDHLGRLVDRLPVPAGPAGARDVSWRPRAHVAAGVYYGRCPASRGTVVVRRQ